MINSSAPICSIAILKAKPGKRDHLRAELLALIAFTQKEPGNLEYDLFEMRDEPGAFYMREAFLNQPALDAHMAASYFKEFVAKAGDLLAEPPQLISLDRIS